MPQLDRIWLRRVQLHTVQAGKMPRVLQQAQGYLQGQVGGRGESA